MAQRSQLPAFLRQRMDEVGIVSLRQLAARAEISPETARRLLDGTRAPSEPTLAKVAAVLGVPLTRLRTLAGRPSGEAVPFRLPPEADQLNEQQRDVVLSLVRSLLDASSTSDTFDTRWAARSRSRRR